MKINRRTVPLDMVSLDHKGQHILISTNRQSICFHLTNGTGTVAWHEFTFEELASLLQKLAPGIKDLLSDPTK